jgi:hypothetical protein
MDSFQKYPAEHTALLSCPYIVDLPFPFLKVIGGFA